MGRQNTVDGRNQMPQLPVRKRARIRSGPFSVSTGFTLLELLAVIAIIGMLAGLGCGGAAVARRKAAESRAQADLGKVRTALEEYRVEFGRYPAQRAVGPVPQQQALEQLVDGLVWIDPWGRDYRYCSSARFSCSVWSEGRDPSDPSDNLTEAGY